MPLQSFIGQLIQNCLPFSMGGQIDFIRVPKGLAPMGAQTNALLTFRVRTVATTNTYQASKDAVSLYTSDEYACRRITFAFLDNGSASC